MNIAYFRKSRFSKEETIDNLKNQALKSGFQLSSEKALDNGKHLIYMQNQTWFSDLLSKNKNLVGMLPGTFYVEESGGEVTAGSGNPTVLAAVTQSADVARWAETAEATIRNIINSATGSEDLKPSNVRLFSTQTCPYCKMEKEWLESEGITHEVVYVDQNQDMAQYMVQRTGQMGVPVTEVMYEDMDSEFIVGFDKPHLSKLLIGK